MRVSLIICTYNRPDYLHDTVAQAIAQRYHDLEIIVVDQTPRNPPEVEAFPAQWSPPRFIYRTLARAGLTAARNDGLGIATGELVIFVDDDVTIDPDFVAKHVAAHRRWEKVAASDPARFPVGGISGVNLSPRTPTWEAVRAQQAIHHGKHASRRGEVWEAEWLTGCNMSFRREVLLRAGGFDERLTGGAWGEDVDISLSVRGLGYRLVMERGLGLWHHQAQAGGGAFRARDEAAQQYERMAAWLYLIRKHWRTFGHLEALWRLWRQYRMYAGSLRLWRHQGWRMVWTRHQQFFGAWRRTEEWLRQ